MNTWYSIINCINFNDQTQKHFKMKKLLLAFVSLSMGIFASAQINNADFENWSQNTVGTTTYDSLHQWFTYNDFAFPLAAANGIPTFLLNEAAFQEQPGSTNASALRLETVDCQPCGQAGLPTTIPGFALNTSEYTQRPESISFDYKFSPVNGDWAGAAILLTAGGGNDTIAGAIIPIETAQSTYTSMTVPFSYFSGANPDSIRISLFSSGDTILNAYYPNAPAAQVGTEFIIDNLQLNMPTPNTASPVGNILAADIDNNGNGLDLEVQFAAGMDENTISEYRIMAVKEANAGSFDLTAAQAVAAANYYQQTTMGIPLYSGTYTAASTDVDGDPIQNGQPYKIFVMSVADGVNATNDNLSIPSNTVTLQPGVAVPPANVVAADVADNGNGTDLDIYFTQSPDETTVGEYRIMIVKSGAASSFNLTAAQAVGASNYVSVTPNGTDYQSVQTASTTDVDGDAVQNNQPYRVFVLAVADGNNAGIDALSPQSNEVELTDAAGIGEYDPSFSIYPNPAKNNVFVNTQWEAYKLTVTSVDGKVVYNATNNSNTVINVSGWSKGVYVFTLRNDNQTKTQKIMIK